MAAGNPFQQLSNLYIKPALIPGEVSQIDHLTKDDKALLQRIGLTTTQVRRDLQQDTQIFYDRYNLYHHVERCLQGDTKIRLLDNSTSTIREMANNSEKYIGKYTFSINPDTLEIEPDEITAAMKTRLNVQLVRIHLDNNKYVDCTPDHRFMLRDGTYREAQYLKPDDSLMPLYTKLGKKGRKLVYNPRHDRYIQIAKSSYGYIYKTTNLLSDKVYVGQKKGMFNPHYLGSGTCLQSALKKYGGDNFRVEIIVWAQTKEEIDRLEKKYIAEYRSVLGRENVYNIADGGDGAVGVPGKKQSQEIIDKRVAGWKKNLAENGKIFSNPKAAHKSLSEGQKRRFQNPDEYEKQLEHLKRVHEKNKKSKETRTCISSDCNVTFDVHPSSKRRYCTVSCGNRDGAKKKETIEKHSIIQSKLWGDEEYKKTQTEKQQAGKRKKVENQKAELVECLLNHKVTKVEWLKEREDTYDITTKKNHNFPLDAGVFVHNSLEHSLVGAAMELYANYCTVFSPLHNATIWITSESPTYQRELTKLLDRIGIEEKIFDWAFTAGSYGDMFVKVNGLPGQGVVSVDDSDHPINISRVDHEGILIGYYKSPLGQAGDQQKLMAPWEYVHFRLLGGKKQRPRFGDQNYSEFRTVHLLTGLRSKQVTTRYGTSLLLNALPIYRRLRLAEDSLLLARLSRGLIRYIWKLKVSHTNMEAVGELMDQYSRVLREARSLDTREGSPNFDSKENPMAAIEDIFIPVWDDVGDLTYDKIGGEADIRWIKDIEDLRQQLAAALRTPLPLLGAWLKEASGSLGSQAIEKADINFARMARKLQRTVRNGVKRICQIHLAYMNMDPDPSLFDVQMPEMSTAEEESLKESLRDGTEVVGSIMDIVDKVIEGDNREVDKIEIFNYCNEKFLKLEDFDLKDFVVSSEALPECKRRTERMAKELRVKRIVEKAMKEYGKTGRTYPKPVLFDTDLVSYVPTRIRKPDKTLDEKAVKKLCRRGGWLGVERSKEVWAEKFGNTMVKEGVFDGDVDSGEQLILPFEKDE